MYRLSLIDAWILVGIYRAEQHGDTLYAEIIASLPDINLPLPTHEEFSAAYNKFLYIRFSVADGNSTTLSDTARQIVESVKKSLLADDNDWHWVYGIHKILSSYKFKSICDRQVWTESQYIVATVLKKD